ncbi:MAG: phosphoenolpyruvate synthase regulatory protein [Clostridiales bacterium]|nr:MAG: phosphoenolpyruvate synthase regulatory protein [Clostridiales bacterium]
MNYTIHIISDSLGDTAEQVTEAVICQFKDIDYKVKKYSYVQSIEKLKKIFLEVDPENSIIIFTVIIDELRNYIIDNAVSKNIQYIDVMSPLLLRFSKFLGTTPINKPGYKHRLDAEYFDKIEAIEFAVKYDDGKDIKGIYEADCVIIGISRTSKTPLSMYLAHRNIKALNIPLVPEMKIPKELYEIDNKKIFCLTNDENVLKKIRVERLKELGLDDSSSYASLDRIIDEIKFGNEIAKSLDCKLINVSDKAIEETANIIIRKLNIDNSL